MPAPGEAPPNPVFFRTAATDVFLSAALTQYASTAEGATRRRPAIVLVPLARLPHASPV